MVIAVTTIYSLKAEDRELLEVAVEIPAWLPVRPKLPGRWMCSIVTGALRAYIRRRPAYLRCDRDITSPALN
jgi:hypothetical protein